jgi:hypothetical protein
VGVIEERNALPIEDRSYKHYHTITTTITTTITHTPPPPSRVHRQSV